MRFSSSIKDGQTTEDRFKNLSEAAGFKCTEKSDMKSQVQDHIDFELKGKVKVVSVDVKGMRRKSRRDKNVSSEIIWLEFKNVRGRKGWLYGKASFISFERESGFAFINREELKDWAEKNIDLTTMVKSSKLAYKKGYQREGRDDLISFVYSEDIEPLIDFEVLENGKIKKHR